MLGYFFVFCLASSSSDKWGPGYRGPSLRSRAGWDGGVNLEGFSRTRGFDFDFEFEFEFELKFFFLLEALRIVREVEVGIERRVRQIALLCGSRNRGIEVVGGMVYSESSRGSTVVSFHSHLCPSLQENTCTETSARTKLHRARSVICRMCGWSVVRLSNIQVSIGPEEPSAVAVLLACVPTLVRYLLAVIFPT
jgi:hypothetical protein